MAIGAIAPVQATIYRWVNSQGSTVFSDQTPPTGAHWHKIELKPLPVLPSRQQTSATQTAISPGTPLLSLKTRPKILITFPRNRAGIRSNNGNITIQLKIKPASRFGEIVKVYLDGQLVFSGHGLTVGLKNLDRGQHEAYAVLATPTGQVISRSNLIIFYILKHSILFKKPSITP